MRTLLVCLLILPPGLADTLVLKGGLELHGAVSEAGDRVTVTLDGQSRTFDRDRVARIERGLSMREDYSRRAAAIEEGDAAAWFRLALWAREKRLPQARTAFAQVLAIDPDHRAARREAGYERVGDRWLTPAEAKRAKGFVLAGGRWLLPEEADRLMREGLMAQAEVTATHRERAGEIARALADDDPEMRAAAEEMMSELPEAAMVRPLRRVLFAPQPEQRILAVKTLGRIGDRTALPWLIQTSMYDARPEVRAAAMRSIRNFKDADVFYPYARALFSPSSGARVMAANALAALGDERGVDVILRRVHIGIGESPRVNLMVGTQQSYIQDFDVEIAQAAAIGDPIVQTIRDGVILDFKILGGHGEGYTVERAGYARALQQLTGRDYGEDWSKYAAFAKEQGYPTVKLSNP